MQLPQNISHPFHSGHHDEVANNGATTDATSPVPSRPPERRKSKFLEEGMVSKEKLDLRSGEESETFDSCISPPEQKSGHVNGKDKPWLQKRRPEWRREDPFGDEDGAIMKYKTMTWWQATLGK